MSARDDLQAAFCARLAELNPGTRWIPVDSDTPPCPGEVRRSLISEADLVSLLERAAEDSPRREALQARLDQIRTRGY